MLTLGVGGLGLSRPSSRNQHGPHSVEAAGFRGVTIGMSASRNQHGPHSAGLDRGSVLLLFPAAVMVILVLAAIVIDIGLARVRVQELRVVASSAANDALGAVDADALRNTGVISFDRDEARRLVAAAVAAGPLPQATVDSVVFSRNARGLWEIAVTVSMRIDLVIAPALPGGTHSLSTSVTERVLAIS